MIKIAVASEGHEVATHFGHCSNFMIFETEDGRILAEESVPNPGHAPGFLPNYLGDLGVGIVIAGGMGAGAIEIFNERQIIPILGASGDARQAVESYLCGELYSTATVCVEHQHRGECGH